MRHERKSALTKENSSATFSSLIALEAAVAKPVQFWGALSVIIQHKLQTNEKPSGRVPICPQGQITFYIENEKLSENYQPKG